MHNVTQSKDANQSPVVVSQLNKACKWSILWWWSLRWRRTSFDLFPDFNKFWFLFLLLLDSFLFNHFFILSLQNTKNVQYSEREFFSAEMQTSNITTSSIYMIYMIKICIAAWCHYSLLQPFNIINLISIMLILIIINNYIFLEQSRCLDLANTRTESSTLTVRMQINADIQKTDWNLSC